MTDEPDFGLANEKGAAMGLLCTSAVLSISGSMFILVTFAKLKRLRTAELHVVAALAVCELASAVFYLPWAPPPLSVGGYDATFNMKLCELQAIALNYFVIASYVWVGNVGAVLYMALEGASEDHLMRRLRLLHAVAWTIPLAHTLALVILGEYGRTQQIWCWIPPTQTETTDGLRQSQHAIGLAVWIALLPLYGMVLLRVYQSGLRRARLLVIVRRSLLVLVVFSLFEGPALLNRMVFTVLQQDYSTATSLMECALAPSMGFLTCVAVLLSRSLLREWRLFCNRQQTGETEPFAVNTREPSTLSSDSVLCAVDSNHRASLSDRGRHYADDDELADHPLPTDISIRSELLPVPDKGDKT